MRCGGLVESGVQFRPILPDHPYLKDHTLGTWSPGELDKMYQPTDAEWPVYWLKVHRHETGISIHASFKLGILCIWEESNFFQPIPFDLMGSLGTMILRAMP
jgi:hypothetical protein